MGLGQIVWIVFFRVIFRTVECVTVHSVADLWTTCMRYWKQLFGNSHDVLYEVICDLLICASDSTGLHDKQAVKVLIKSGS